MPCGPHHGHLNHDMSYNLWDCTHSSGNPNKLVLCCIFCILENVLVELIFGQAPLASVAFAQLGRICSASFTNEQHIGPLAEMHDVCRMECKMSARMAH